MDNNEYAKMILYPFFPAKRYYLEMIPDLRKIITIRGKLFSNFISDAPRALELLEGYDGKPKFKYRMYVITSVRIVDLAYIDIPEEFFENILLDVKQKDSDFSYFENLDPCFVTTVYFYKNSKIIYEGHILPGVLSWILNSLKEENLVDYSLINRWTDNLYDMDTY